MIIMCHLVSSSIFIVVVVALITLSSSALVKDPLTGLIMWSDGMGVCPPEADFYPCACNPFPDGDDKNFGTLWLYCDGQQLDDTNASIILNAFISTPLRFVSPLREVYMRNNSLTRVPPELRLFGQLNRVALGHNHIRSVQSTSFNMTQSTLTRLSLKGNAINRIEPGAFDAIKCGANSQLVLIDNNLTRIEAGVFRSVIEQMSPFVGNSSAGVYMQNNPLDCVSDPCHLAWLVGRKNRQRLLSVLKNAKCSNGTALDQLDIKSLCSSVQMNTTAIITTPAVSSVMTSPLSTVTRVSSSTTTKQSTTSSTTESTSLAPFNVTLVDPLLEGILEQLTNDTIEMLNSNSSCPTSDMIAPCKCIDPSVSNKQTIIYSGLLITCKDQLMGDVNVSQLLNFFLVAMGGDQLIGQLILSNTSLSRVPDEIRFFNNLNYVDLRYNKITIIPSGAFKFPTDRVIAPGKIDLAFNRIKNIERGAFQGQILVISLYENRLTRFDADVFLSVLQAMSQDSRSQGINLDDNPVDCSSDPCQLAWLIRDNPDLNLLVEDGECSNGTQFNQLDKRTFDDFLCPSPSLIDMANATASLTREEADELKKKMSVVPSAVVSSVVAIILLVCVGFVVYKYLRKTSSSTSPLESSSSSGFFNQMMRSVSAKIEARSQSTDSSPRALSSASASGNNYEMF